MKSFSSMTGLVSGIGSIVLWLIMIFFNPYSSPVHIDTKVLTFVMIGLPACLAILASLLARAALMLAAFIWSLPVSLYLLMTPGIFSLFGVTCALYLISFIVMVSVRAR
ncbi:hypothetical protein ACFQ88_22215 [Paenibacillus sp. NPDC056579]|uniref:hypothetical protein n=1 Tax=Paenibacillus sp. NPDC056579 TaxID=3345871 RepID=UPI00369A0443